MSHMRYELGFYITKDGIVHSIRRESLKSSFLVLYGLKPAANRDDGKSEVKSLCLIIKETRH
jgi:hypothetical protein